METVFQNKSHLQYWEKAANGTIQDSEWEELYQPYKATTDFPACCFYLDYHRMYPDAKVILAIRDFESWYKSASNTIYGASFGWAPKVLAWFFPWFRRLHATNTKIIWNGEFQGRFLDKEAARKVYEHHISEVKRLIPKDQLLLFDVKKGWEPLCKFLGKPIPKQPFPNVNDTKQFQRRILVVKVIAVSLLVLSTTSILFALKLLVKYLL
eukprot:TRINITY_DN1867_c0_g1_i2.p1 TRINITY_DN1867_c0_g1~~TRINITY_DN1867_c0_g1_i2.p1  ORF type:complete len:210 (+),score=16.53 TRINITY_DN1867_c0_g1_i2:290-919(+)